MTQQLVIFGLFDRELDDEVRIAMATTLHATPRPAIFPLGKPEFPVNILLYGNNLTLEDFIGPNSWLLFDLLGCYGRWLALPLAQWEEDEEYKQMCSIVCNIPVVNDAAERGVKDVQDYANSANDGAYRGKIVVVANTHRVKIPQFLKNEMEENL